ncbi:unnamed protein product [Paramecium octaurelia]|uniref:Uncharacterized protein n=1 Tax=Paramecium octaurelia TaxID=43137 RepID=A0A8S1V9B5_PAROT|nr:unnamed protein product [Paramecium octaurelia]
MAAFIFVKLQCDIYVNSLDCIHLILERLQEPNKVDHEEKQQNLEMCHNNIKKHLQQFQLKIRSGCICNKIFNAQRLSQINCMDEMVYMMDTGEISRVGLCQLYYSRQTEELQFNRRAISQPFCCLLFQVAHLHCRQCKNSKNKHHIMNNQFQQGIPIYSSSFQGAQQKMNNILSIDIRVQCTNCIRYSSQYTRKAENIKLSDIFIGFLLQKQGIQLFIEQFQQENIQYPSLVSNAIHSVSFQQIRNSRSVLAQPTLNYIQVKAFLYTSIKN